MKPIEIQLTYDFICPWCWIGHRHLQAALAQAPSDTAMAIRYLPYELNPDMPKDGADRKAYRSAKFGSWARSQAMDAQVALAGRRTGAEFHYDRVAVTPNTRLAHRLMFFAAGKGDAASTEALFESVFHAYFSEGQDIGQAELLAALASRAGFEAQEVRRFLATSAGEREVVAAERQAQLGGVRSVPTLRIGNTLISGAQPAAALADALRQAAAQNAAAPGA
ncbi:DsbA family oxidoreductase [Variovorax terrae]|uniref:DsbA family oxidoreductase n=1 Tax=Variovorax terrae TaxID=2923278 RepID=A0A9X2ARN5_9BURK|nr:DsbA family oxidoreductase [Variovorax terrae]MCJ0764376.1 DsbA family oxidoreductase [Variovorax terrae]